LLISEKRPWREVLSVIFVGLGIFIVHFLFQNGYQINLVFPLISLFGSYFGVASYNFILISTERKKFLKLAVTDELTDLYNIRYFKMVLRAECLIAKADEDKKFCVIMTDIDRFKHFNDTYGHQTGDLVLKEISNVIKTSVRSSDVVARYGGEEIIILLRGTVLSGGECAAEKIRRNVANHIVRDKDNICKITLSLGVAVFEPQYDYENEDTIIKRADIALYEAKQKGRNCVSTGKPDEHR